MHFKMSSAICFNLDQSKILWPGNGLRWHQKDQVGPPVPACQGWPDKSQFIFYHTIASYNDPENIKFEKHWRTTALWSGA